MGHSVSDDPCLAHHPQDGRVVLFQLLEVFLLCEKLVEFLFELQIEPLEQVLE